MMTEEDKKKAEDSHKKLEEFAKSYASQVIETFKNERTESEELEEKISQHLITFFLLAFLLMR